MGLRRKPSSVLGDTPAQMGNLGGRLSSLRLSRRQLLYVSSATAATALLAACGGDDDGGDESATTTEAEEDDEPEETTTTTTEAAEDDRDDAIGDFGDSAKKAASSRSRLPLASAKA